MTYSQALRLGLVKMLVIAGLAATAPSLRAQEADLAFFKGKTVKLLVGYGAGGGYDVYARMIAPALAKVLDATIVVENQPGGGGLVALNRLSNAPPDGLTMMIVNGTGAALSQLSGLPGVRYDLAKLGHLGTVSASPWMWLVAPNLPIKTPQEAIEAGRRLNWAAGGRTDGLSGGAAFACEALRLDCRIVLGYGGSSQAALAVARGETDAIYVSDTSANTYVKAGNARAMAAMSRSKSRFFPTVPTIFEAVKLDADQQWVLDFRATIESLGRILVAPPDIPAARLAALQAAVRKTLTDPAFVAEGERTQRYIDYLSPDATRKNALAVVAGTTPEQKKRVQDILTKPR